MKCRILLYPLFKRLLRIEQNSLAFFCFQKELNKYLCIFTNIYAYQDFIKERPKRIEKP